MRNQYLLCEKDHGANIQVGKPGGPVGAEDVPALTAVGPVPGAAVKACESKLPINPPELDKTKNPNYFDDYRKQIVCMQRKGAPIKMNPDQESWTYTSSSSGMSAAALQKIEQACRVEAFSD